jgi:sulfite reductase (NADPH) hemoprotein beta-component
MYRYDEFDAALVADRVAQFRGQVERRLSGELTEDQFKPLRLRNGVYLQLHAYMLRIAVPYGTLSSRQMRCLAMLARTYDKGYGHFTTRQNIQFNWPALVDVPAMLEALAAVEMHAIQTSGNCVRNISADQFAGAADDELEDPRPWCEILRQWSTFHPEFSFLPRKFKIAITAAETDRAAVRVHDIGLHIKRNPKDKGSDGEIGFEVIVGGGQGRTPYVGVTIRDFLPKTDLLAYTDAILRVYNRYGRRDNIHKARIKILVQSLGPEEFARQVEDEFVEVKKTGVLALPEDEMARIAAYFAPPAFKKLPARSKALEAARKTHSEFDRWVRVNTHAHKVPGYTSVTISLKPIGGAPGDATDAQMETVADVAERFSFDEVRVTHEQNLVLPHVELDQLHALWETLKPAGLATANVGLVSDIIACPGLDFCNLANARSIGIAEELSRRFADLDRAEDIGELRIKISGCINACGHHHVGHIGILGVDKKGEEYYQITLGGRADEKAAIGRIAGPGLSAKEIPGAFERIIARYLELRTDKSERFIDALERLGDEPFKTVLYGEAVDAAR